MSSTPGAGFARFLASWRMLALAAVAISAVVVFGVQALHQQITQRAVDSAVLGARTIEVLVVSRNLTLQDIWLSLDQRDADVMDGDLTLIRSDRTILGLRVWALVDGHLVYGDQDHRAGAGALPEQVRSSIRQGQPYTAEGVDEPTGAGSLSVFLPNDANGDGVYDAATEVLVPRTRIDGTVTTATRWLYGGAAVALLAVFFILFMIRRHQQAQDHATTHDLLTGLGNRALLYRSARGLLTRATEAAPTAVFLIDLDGFKGVNDTLGHQAGDELLVVVAERLAGIGRARCTPIRLGGDEFAVLATGIADRADGIALAREMRDAIRQPITAAGVAVEVDASIGVAFAPADGVDLAGLMRHADLAMYDAKQHNAGVVCYQPGALQQDELHVTLVPEFRRALTAGELELCYRPLVAGDAVTAVEASLRWRHPTRGLLEAADFVPEVAKTSLVKELISWLLDRAMTDGAAWREQGHPHRVVINLAVRELLDFALVDRLAAASAATGFPIEQLQLEITEAALRGERVSAAIDALTTAGVQVIIDAPPGRAACEPLPAGELGAWLDHRRAELRRTDAAGRR